MKAAIAAIAALFIAVGAQAKTRRPAAEPGSSGTAPARPVAPGDVNGRWSIEAATTVGDCVGLIPSGLEIDNGRVTGATGFAGATWGYVDAAGRIGARFTSGSGHIARLHGSLRGGQGSGAWSSSTDFCGGVWRAARRQESAGR